MTRARAFLAPTLTAILVVAALLQPLAAAAQTPDIEARVEVSGDQFTLGDRVRVTITVLHPDSVLVDVVPPEATATLRVLETLLPTTEPGAIGKRSITRFEFVLAPFALGAQQLAPLRLTWLEEDGNSGDIAVEVPVFVVNSTVPANDSAPRPLKAQLSVGGRPPAWQRPAAFGAATLLVMALIAFGAWRLARRRPAPVVVPALAPQAEDEARQRLEEMARANPLGARDYDTYYGTISSVVRGYLAERFEFGATALTTRELERRMTAEGVERWQARLVGGLLDRCDAAVYARQQPRPASADHDLTVAFEIIELSRPRPEPAAVEDVA